MADLMLRIVGQDDASHAFNQVSGASKRLDAATRQVATSQSRSHRAFSTTKRILTGLATSYAAIKVGQFAKESIQAASDVNEALTATEQVFKRQSNTIKAWSKGSAADFGQTRTQALSTARQFGTLFKSAGVGGKKLGEYSTGLTELASDIASFNNVPVQQAIEDMTSGLTGQVEPMRKYGVFLSANALKAEAMRMGIADGTATLTDSQRTLAAYNLILRQTGVTSDKFAKQFGDFDRTAGGFANQTRILTANWQGFKGAFGQAILPLATGTVKGLNQIIPELSRSLTDGGLGKTLESWGPKAESFFTSLRTNLPEISSLAGDFADAAGIIGDGLKGVFDTFNSLPDGVRQGIILLGTAAATMKMLNRAAGGGGMTAFGNQIESIPHAVVRAGMGTAAAEAVKAVFGNRIGTMTIQAGVVNINGGKINGGGGGGGGAVGKAAAGGGALATAGATAAGLAISAAIVLAIKSGIDRHYGDTVQGNRQRQQAINNSRLGDGSQRGSQYSTSTGGGIRQPNLPNNSGRLRAEAEGFREVTRQAKETAGSLTRLSGVSTRWGEAAKQATMKGIGGVTAFGAAVKKVPAKKHTSIKADGADEARGKVQGLGGAIGGLKGKTVPVRESGAQQSQGRVKGLGGAIGGLKGKTVSVKVQNAQAVAALAQVTTALAAVQPKTIDVVTRYRTEGGGPGKPAMAATGGYISGPGTATSDSIPAMLSDGEYVIRAAAVRRYGRAFFDAANATALSGFASGGQAKAKRKAQAQDLRQARRENRQAASARAFDALDPQSQTNQAAGEVAAARAAIKAAKTDKKRAAAVRKLTAAQERFAQASSALTDQQNASTEATNEAAAQAIADRDAAWQSMQQARQDRAWADAPANVRASAAQNEVANLNAQIAATSDPARLAQLFSALEDAEEKLTSAQDQILDQVNALRDAVDGLAGGFRAFAGIGTTAVNDVADAQSKLTEANDAVAAAQKKMDLAGSDRERAAAAAELTKALQAQQSAQQGVNQAGKPTSASIKANMASRLQKLRDFSTYVQQLKAGGLNATTLAEILQMGPEQGADFAKALLDGGFADIDALQNQITTESATLGFIQNATNAASDSLTGYAAAQAAGLVIDGIVMAPAPVTVTIDGNAIAQALISYKRQNGGSAPGLNI